MKVALHSFVLSVLVGASSMAQASLLKLEKGARSIQGVNISRSAEATIDAQTIHLGTVGAGLRWKKILLTKVNVYVAQLLLENPERFVKTDKDALKSLEDSNTVAIQLTFLRTVDAPTVQSSLRQALLINKVDLNNESVKAFLDAVKNGGDATSGNNMTIVLQKHSDGSETLVYEDSMNKQAEIKSDKGLTQKILAIWLGNPADEGVASCKSDLLSQ